MYLIQMKTAISSMHPSRAAPPSDTQIEHPAMKAYRHKHVYSRTQKTDRDASQSH